MKSLTASNLLAWGTTLGMTLADFEIYVRIASYLSATILSLATLGVMIHKYYSTRNETREVQDQEAKECPATERED